MKENFLHYLWFYKLFSQNNLKTYQNNEYLEIINFGKKNYNSGPDFLEAEIIIANKIWIGSIEIHVNSSDWNKHKHSNDLAYKNVILHVVWNHDCEIDVLRQRNVPTLILQDFIKPEIICNYKTIINTELDKIHCKKFIKNIDLKNFSFWLEKILVERFEEKTENILDILKINHNNWEETLFKSLAKNFGLAVNVNAFEVWSNSFDFKIIQKIQFDALKIEALFFGQAGFLTENIANEYYKNLQKEYEFLKAKYQLNPISNELFRFSKMRPLGFPTIRIAQLAALYYSYNNLFSKITSIYDLNSFYLLFENIQLNPFWDTHYTLKSESTKKIGKNLSKDKINNIIINTIIPIRYTYDRYNGKENIDFYFNLLENIKPEKNSVLDEFEAIGFENKSAKNSQELIHLKKRYCTEKKCLNCAIGNEILK
ncbi:DUF2851 family protein [Chishuiella sp.]|uniref:DUF2851 family protein n=1 Tax=Chishuiella sp. TaxID=1969467 RepID=UPI0028AB2F63|nr:DUF2851 family protein [Chishuiella sp.]